MTRKRLTRSTKSHDPAAVTDLLRHWGLLNRQIGELSNTNLTAVLERTQRLIQQSKPLTRNHSQQQGQASKLRFACEQQRQQMLVVIRRTRNLLFHVWQKFTLSALIAKRFKLLLSRLLLLEQLLCRRRHHHRAVLWRFFYGKIREREEKPIPIILPNLFDRHTPIGMMTMYPQLAHEALQLARAAYVTHKPDLCTRLYTIAKLFLSLANAAMGAYIFNIPLPTLHGHLQQKTQDLFDELARDYPTLTKIIRPKQTPFWSKLWQPIATNSDVARTTTAPRPRPQPMARAITAAEEVLQVPTGQSSLRY